MLSAWVLALVAGTVAGQAENAWPDVDATVLREAPVAASDARWTLWVGYGHERGAYLDHASFLRDLQERHREQGLRVVVAMPVEPAQRLAANSPGVGVARIEAPHLSSSGLVVVVLESAGGAQRATWIGIDGCVDRVVAALAGKLERTAPVEADDELASALDAVGDSGDVDDLVAHVLECLPHSGRARALAVLHAWWCKGDYAAARRAFDQGLAALDGSGPMLVAFADLVLRGDSVDTSIPRSLAVALAPAAAAAPDGAFTQTVYLRALLRAGQVRPAARLVERLPALVGDDAGLRLLLAETLMEAPDPKPWRSLAISLVTAKPDTTAPEETAIDERLRLATLHKIHSRCGAEPALLAELLSSYRLGSGFGGSLNNEAWYMCTEPGTMGRFPAFALAHADEMARLGGKDLDAGSKDTVALVAFCNGQWKRAIELQREAAAASDGDTRYAARLRRFEAAVAWQEAQRSKKSETPR